MSMISYAQNYEDVILWRALKNVTNGFYIDVGAWDPIDDSVTKWFYENDWRGINIEPNIYYWNKLKEARPRDINLCVAIADTNSYGTLNVIDVSGLSTLDNKVAQIHVNKGLTSFSEPVKIQTLTSVLDDQIVNDIHFLKIDAEGFETKILEGLDLARYRPWIIMLEAVNPNTRYKNITDNADWETLITLGKWHAILEKNKYQKVYADGINVFYIADEHSDYKVFFQYPPNVFDNFQIARQMALEVENSALLKSTSWRITKPLRLLGSIVRIASSYFRTVVNTKLKNTKKFIEVV
jgi:FkbM family methyltransferase